MSEKRRNEKCAAEEQKLRTVMRLDLVFRCSLFSFRCFFFTLQLYILIVKLKWPKQCIKDSLKCSSLQ